MRVGRGGAEFQNRVSQIWRVAMPGVAGFSFLVSASRGAGSGQDIGNTPGSEHR